MTDEISDEGFEIPGSGIDDREPAQTNAGDGGWRIAEGDDLYYDNHGNKITLPTTMDEFKTYIMSRKPEPLLRQKDEKNNFDQSEFEYFEAPVQQTKHDLTLTDDVTFHFEREEPVAEFALP
eukprot:5577593-Pyramimonas_sp.AAC.1